MTLRISPAALTFLGLALSASSPGAPLDLTPRVLPGNVHRSLAAGKVVGAVDRAAPMEKMLLSLKPSPEARRRRDALLRDQQDPKSPLFHQWLTPQQFGERFGPSAEDLATVTGWLKAQGFTIDEVTRGRGAILFSGTAGAVMDAFRTQLAKVEVGGAVRQGNLTDPSIPEGLAALVDGVASLHNVPLKPMNSGAKVLGPVPKNHARVVDPHYTTQSGYHFLAPTDFATIYNAAPLYKAGNDGTGMAIAIVGRTDIRRSDIEAFRSYFGLPADKLEITYNGPNPGINNDETEADLDVEWSGAAAPGATVNFVTSASTDTGDGIIFSLLYIIDNNVAPVVSMSYGSGESLNGATFSSQIDNLYAQAAAQGQTIFISSGDAGAAGADGGNDDGAYYPIDINALGASPNVVCVGGTQFNEQDGTFWTSQNDAFHASALGYIPEVAWNESGTVPGGYGCWSTGGGFSAYLPQPWFQSPLLPGATMRAVPDVALSAASHDGYLVVQDGYLESVGGTSAASPAFAGLLALVVQRTGQRQGNANPVLYQLGADQYTGEGPKVFHDITSGNNSVPWLTGFDAVQGYDPVTGLGSVDAQAMAANWIVANANQVTAAITSPAAGPVVFKGGGTQTFTATGTDSNPLELLTYTWNFGDGSMATGPTVTHTYTTGATTTNYPVTLTVTDSTGNLAADTRLVRVTSADINHDGTRTLLDLLQWSADYGTQNLDGDLNGDGGVDDADLAILLGAL